VTRLSDEAWRAKMEGKSFRQPEPLPLFDAVPAPLDAQKVVDRMVDGFDAGGEEGAVKAGLGAILEHVVTEGVKRVLVEHPEILTPPSTAAQETAPRPPTVAIVCSRGRGGGCRRVELPNDEAVDPWAKARAEKAQAPTPFEVGMAASAAAGDKWTPGEVATLRAAVRTVAARGFDFTSDDVWKLCPTVKFTKGMGRLLVGMAGEGVMHSTHQHRVSTRGGDHDHAQSLTLWRPGPDPKKPPKKPKGGAS